MQRLQSKQEELTEEEEMKQQQRMAKTVGGFLELLAKDIEKAWTRTGWEDTCTNGINGWST